MAVTDRIDSPRSRTAEPTFSSGAPADQRLSELFAPCFALILNLRTTDELGDPSVLRDRIKDLLDQTERDALSTGRAPETIQTVKFAVVAFLDETILSSDWPHKDEWMNTPLQLELYDQYDAGEVFFDRLRTFLDDPQRYAEVLEVYYLCMALGFKGQYRIHEQEKLREYVERAADVLAEQGDWEETGLAPRGLPREEAPSSSRRTVPTWVIGVAALALGVLIYAGMYFYISASAYDVASTIRQMAAT